MTTKRTPQLHEYRQAVIGIQNAVFMEPILKLRLRDELEQLIATGKYIKQLEEERHALLDRVKATEEAMTRSNRLLQAIKDKWEKDNTATDNYLREAFAMIQETGCTECLGAGFVFTQKTPCEKCNPQTQQQQAA